MLILVKKWQHIMKKIKILNIVIWSFCFQIGTLFFSEAQNTVSRICIKDTMTSSHTLSYQLDIQNTHPKFSVFRYQQFFKDSLSIISNTHAEVIKGENNLYTFLWRPSSDSVLTLAIALYPKDSITFNLEEAALIEWTTSGKVYKTRFFSEIIQLKKEDTILPQKDKIYYLVQIATLSMPKIYLKSQLKLKNQEQLMIEKCGHLYKHYIGFYTSQSEAETALKTIRKQSDFSKPFIVKIIGKQLLKYYPYSSY